MSLFYDNENYELSTSVETNSLLAELPFELMKELISEQINDPMSTNNNYIDIIIEKSELFKDSHEDNEDIIAELNDNLRSFFVSIMQRIDDAFELGLDIESIASRSDVVEIGEVLYNYFVLRYVKNISKFITKYILTHKKELADYYIDKNKKDVSTMALKKQIKNQDDIVIVSNLPSIIKYVINLDIDPEEFVSLNTGADNYEGTVIRSLISSGQMVGDFVYEYIQKAIVDHDYIIDEIQTDIKTKIFKKMNKN